MSVVRGAAHVAVARHEASAFKLILPGHPVITGTVVSVTITSNEQVDVFPLPSVAV